MIRKITLFVFFLINAFAIAAQELDSLSVREAEEIRYKAERLINRELRDLLNNIANTASDQKSLNDMIKNSHSGTRNKIFFSDKVLIEDDINPNHKSAAGSQDIEVDKYLRDFDVLYTKSDERSVTFNNVRVSRVKKQNYVYVNVYYSSFFSNQNKSAESAYSVNNRVAEIKVEKDNNTWVPYIVRIGFFNPADTVNNFSNDLVLKNETTTSDTLILQDSAALANLQTSIEEDIRKKEQQLLIENDRKENERFIELLNDGDEALRNNSFADALALYAQARELKPYDPLPLSKINKANKQREHFILTANQLHDQYIQQALLAENNRDYQKAIGLYNNAISQKPETREKYQSHVNQLTAKFRVIDELEEKYKAGLYREAVREYEAAIRRDNKNSDFFLGRGKCFYKLGEYQKAMKDFNQAYELDHQNLQALDLRAGLHTRNKDYFKAQTDYKTYLTINKNNADIYQKLSEIRLLINHENFQDALADLDAGISIQPRLPELYIKKGMLLSKKNDFKKAAETFTTALKIDSANAFTYYSRGQCWLAMNNIALAAADFKEARKNRLDSVNLKEIESYAEPFFKKAVVKHESSAIDSAMVYIDYAISIHPTNDLYWFTRGEYHFEKKNFQESVESYNRAIASKHDYTEALSKKGDAYYHLHDYKAAIEAYTAALNTDPKFFLAQKGIGESLFALKDYTNAIANLESSIKAMESIKKFANPKFLAEAYNTAGKSYYNQKAFDKAIQAFKNALKKNTEYPEAHFNKGVASYQLGKYEESISDLSKAIGYEKKNAIWYYHLARAYQARKDYKNAVLNYTECINNSMPHIIEEAVYNRGLCYYQAKHFNEALADYLKLQTKIADSISKTFDRELATIYLHVSKYDSAIAHYHKSLQKNAQDGYAMYGIACSLLSQEKKEEALSWFEQSFKAKSFKYHEIKDDKFIAPIKKDRKFKELVKRYY